MIDDYAPKSVMRDRDSSLASAERILRSAGNRSGRSRLNQHSEAKMVYTPRGMLLSSGEDVPGGESMLSRVMVREVGPGDIDPEDLSDLQLAARNGLLSEAMAGYVSWLARMADEDETHLRRELAARLTDLRGRLAGSHRRTPDLIASMGLGVETFLLYAKAAGAIDDEEFGTRLGTYWDALAEIAQDQDEARRDETASAMFLSAVKEVLVSGKAHVADAKTNTEPGGNPAACGWQEVMVGTGIYETPRWQAKGNLIGWVSGNEIWLLPGPTFQAVNQLLIGQGKRMPTSPKTTGTQLKNDKKLLRLSNRETPAVPQRVGGVKYDIWVLARIDITGGVPPIVAGALPSGAPPEPEWLQSAEAQASIWEQYDQQLGKDEDCT